METTALSKSDLATAGCSITLSYVLSRTGEGDFDPIFISDAIDRVIQKWPLLGARLVWEPKTGVWTLVHQDPASASHTLTTSTTSELQLEVLAAPPGPTSARILARPPLDLFRRPSTPLSCMLYAESKSPLLEVHITTVPNGLCIGLTLPHGVFDATGMGHVVHALDAELAGRPWSPPETSSEEFRKAIDRLRTSDVGELAEGLEPFLRDFAPESWWAAIKFRIRGWYEDWWHLSDVRVMYLGEEVVKRIVGAAKAEAVALSGGELVSTGDVLLAWTLKATYLAEPTSRSTLAVASVLSQRPILAAYTSTTVQSYPHNAVLMFYLPFLDISTLPRTSLATIALLHRRALAGSRTPAFLLATEAFITHRGGFGVPRAEIGRSSWVFSNQQVAGLPDIDFGQGTTARGYFMWVLPTAIDNATRINRQRGGYFVSTKMRKARWEAVAGELGRLQVGEEGLVK